MANQDPQYRFGISLGVSHYLAEAMGEPPVFTEEETRSGLFLKYINPQVAKSIASRIFELTKTEPPILIVPTIDRTWMHHLSDGGDFMVKFTNIIHIDGPIDAVEQVGVAEDSNDFYALNRIDKVEYQN